MYTCMLNLNKIHGKTIQVGEQKPSTDGRTEEWTLKWENIIPHHYYVAGYEK